MWDSSLGLVKLFLRGKSLVWLGEVSAWKGVSMYIRSGKMVGGWQGRERYRIYTYIYILPVGSIKRVRLSVHVHFRDLQAHDTSIHRAHHKHTMVESTSKPNTIRASSDDSVASRTSSTHSVQSTTSSLRSALKKPFQGWTKEALWAKHDLDDVYNFPSVVRRGAE